ncbi:MAG TPA: histidine kinase [Thermoleophilaceae bacterium]|jgi:two-component system sensor histidine kinase UhpB|nr:histidine kinase [Thermoleophilaceae bacterium]
MTSQAGGTPRYTPLFQRVAALNAIVLVAACAVTIVVVSPQKLSSIAVGEALVLLAALVLVAAINLYLLRRALAPLGALTALARRVDLTRPGQRVPVSPYESEVSELATTFNEMLERLESERRESTRRVLDAQESERLRVSRELHDEVGQTLTAVLLQLGRIAKHAPPELASELDDAQERARETLEEVRRISRELRPEALDDLGLASALVALSERFGLDVTRRLDRDLPTLDEETELVIYRVAQEALTNVARHSGSGRVELELSASNGSLTLRVLDEGRGIDAEDGGGLRGMRERAVLVGADLSVGRRNGGGTEVRLEVPL